jgi:hypothetical protein
MVAIAVDGHGPIYLQLLDDPRVRVDGERIANALLHAQTE